MTLRTGNRKRRHSMTVVSVSLNPDRLRGLASLYWTPLHLRQHVKDHQQGAEAAALLIERICGNSGGYLVARKSPAHRDRPNRRVLAPDCRQQLVTGHARHVQIGEQNLGNFFEYLRQGGEAILGGPHAVPNLSQYKGQGLSDRKLIVNNENTCF